MKTFPYIFEQNGRYYYKRRIDKDAVFVKSLKTDSLIIAKQIVAIINIKAYAIFGKEAQLNDREEFEHIQKLLRKYVSEAIVEYSRLEAKRHEAYSHNGNNGASPETIEQAQNDISSKMYSAESDTIFQDIFQRTNITKKDIQVLSSHGKDTFKFMLLKEELNILQFDKERNQKYLNPSLSLQNSPFADLYLPNYPAPQNESKPSVTVEVLPSQQISQNGQANFGNIQNASIFIQDRRTAQYYSKLATDIRISFLAKKKREQISDYAEYEKITDMFLNFCCEKYLIDISSQTINDFVDYVFDMPLSNSKEGRSVYRAHKSDLRSIVIESRKLSLPKINVKTANKRIIYAFGMLDWAVESEFLDRNRLSGKLVDTKKDPEKHATFSRKKVGYSDKMLSDMLYSSWYQNIGHTIKTEPWKIYIPIILMYHSFRLNEICSLPPYQILEPTNPEAQGYWCFKTWRGKTAQSTRVIPIHQKLIDLHFIDYCLFKKEQKAKNLWDLEPNGSHGHRELVTKAYSDKEFKGEFIPEEFLADTSLRFDTHSFRHLIGTKLKSVANTFSLNAVFGHIGNRDQTEQYGQDISIKDKAETLAKLSYEVDFKHLEHYFNDKEKKHWFA